MICIYCKLVHEKTINLEEANVHLKYGDYVVDKTVHIPTFNQNREYYTTTLVCHNCGLLYEHVKE